MSDLDRSIEPKPSRRKWGVPYGLLSAKVDRLPASSTAWSRELAEELGLPLDISIGELLVHADKAARAQGKVGYLREDLLRREGAVPTESTVRIDFAEQYERLGSHIRDALLRRGLDETMIATVSEAIVEAIQRVQGAEDAHDE